MDLPGNRHGHHGGEVVPPGPAQGSGGRAVKPDAVAGGTEQISNQDGGGLGSRSKGFPSGNNEAGARGRGGARSGSRGAKVRGKPLLFARDGGLSGRQLPATPPPRVRDALSTDWVHHRDVHEGRVTRAWVRVYP